MILTDIAIPHEYKGRKSEVPLSFIVHPFAETEGEHAGKFEVMLSGRGAGEDKARSGWVTLDELAELYARDLMVRKGLRLRLRPLEDGVYPDTFPGKKVPRSAIPKGSSFDLRILAVDRAKQVSPGVRALIIHLETPPE
ncbi:hypothetical protein PSQ40_03400 [Curvibacter sp. HBC61]|uniref:Uncharacterized protein n=1 Tax=Curvibacter cyanobacteriorum TaxID=3026422 RepID=A0ABT5MVX8_9BURK|nr:hypothetical protein [Curvibacter sp. HBC61]MDD0837611.1 hypothetical protein [Curvibacter sp. HBC61]